MRTTKHKLGYRLVLCLVVLMLFLVTCLTNKNSGLVLVIIKHLNTPEIQEKLKMAQVCTLGSKLFWSWSKFFRKIDSGHQLGNFQVIDVNSFVRNASNRFREAYLWIFVKCIKLAANYLHLHSFPSPRLPQISPTTLQMIYRDTTEE